MIIIYIIIMLKNIKILQIISTLNPRSGGPQAGIIESSNRLSSSNISVDILTSDNKNYLKDKKIKFKIIKLNIKPRSYNFSFKLIKWINKNKKKYDFFIIHGLWEFNSLLARLFIKKNYYIIPHGQLDPYFSNNTFKRIKKQIYWNLIEKKNIINSNGILVSGENEKLMLKNTFVNTTKINIVDIGYANQIQKIKFKKINYKKIFEKKFPDLKNKKFILFIGRIHHKKGCDILLEAIKEIKDLKGYKFLIAGFSEKLSFYEKKIIQMISSHETLKNNITVSNFLTENIKVASLKFSDATILPSRGENFGVSVSESISISKIPLITSKVGIYEYIKKYKAGLVCDANKNSIYKMIYKYINLNQKQKNLYKKNSLKCFNEIFNIKNKNNKLIKLLYNDFKKD